jgi:hypothetical protein
MSEEQIAEILASMDLDDNLSVSFFEFQLKLGKTWNPIVPEPEISQFDEFGWITISWNVIMKPV